MRPYFVERTVTKVEKYHIDADSEDSARSAVKMGNAKPYAVTEKTNRITASWPIAMEGEQVTPSVIGENGGSNG
ncbi:hypothetical protein [Tardiphaga sp.]|jgi:hypothetical protein|uniref:hypothetical protein n=1 Tax=Tardiphaga sp. TaxID=1926292 RepID=UPI0037DA3D51